VDRFLEIAGLITRWFMAALACVFFIDFLFLIGQSAEQSQELAGMAIGKAVICGGAAAIWFYRARKARQMQTVMEYTLKARQSAAPVQLNVSPLQVPTEQTQVAMPPETGPNPQEINKMICGACGKESAGDKFCPHCGKTFVRRPSVIESPIPPPEVQSVTDTLTDESEPIRDGVAGTAIRVGTLVFGAFSAISLLVSIVKGLVPIYLLEAAGWAGVAWYWQGKKTHSDVAKAIVIVLAVMVAIGEVVHIALQADFKSTSATTSDPFEKYAVPSGASSASDYGGVGTAGQNQTVTTSGASAASHVADIEKQAVALFNQKQYREARPLFEQNCNGIDENGFKYVGFDGDMKACNYLGYVYAQGLGGPRNTKQAIIVYQRACDQGTLSSCASLGSLYQDARNIDEASKYFQKACTGGLAEACDLLRGVQ